MDGLNCKHIDDKEILQFEVEHPQGQSPRFTCRVCNQEFNLQEMNDIIEGLI